MEHTLQNAGAFTLKHRGFIITVTRFHSSRFGMFYVATNNYGEPYIDLPAFKTAEQAIEWDKKNLDAFLEEE